MTRPALGKGLNALISEEAATTLEAAPPQAPELTSLPLDRIHTNPHQPRQVFTEDSLNELAASMKQRGILQPVLVTPTPDGNYEIVAGERRWRAAARAGFTEVPVVVKTGSDVERFEMALIENLQREDLNPMDQAAGFERLMAEFHLTQEDIAAVIGKDRTVIANTIRLLQLPAEMQQALRDGKISASHGRALAALEDPAAQKALFERIMSEDLPVRAVEKAVAAHKQVTVKGHARKAPEAKPLEVKALEEDLQRALARKVELARSGPTSQKGWLKLEYYSLEDLDHLTNQLKKSALQS
jgi:ParB family chromosome partitioning protein